MIIIYYYYYNIFFLPWNLAVQIHRLVKTRVQYIVYVLRFDISTAFSSIFAILLYYMCKTVVFYTDNNNNNCFRRTSPRGAKRGTL